MPASPEQLFAFLDELGIKTTTVEHVPVFTVEEAKQVHDQIAGGHCKNLFCKDEKGALWLIVALEDARIDLKKVPERIGSRRLSFGRPELLMEVLGITPGSVTPFALINDSDARVNVILDSAMMEHAVLNYHPLINSATTSVANSDLVKFITATGHHPRVVAVSDTLL
jgi:Ala-tRNA(Pro) deacylase